MNKQQFLEELKNALGNLAEEDIKQSLDFYSEMIDDKIEDGLSEDAAVAEIGDVNKISAQIISEIPLSKIIKEKVSPKRKLSVLEIVLLILGAPIWGSLLITAISVLFALYIVMWSLVASLWAVEVSLMAAAFSGVVAPVIFIIRGYTLPALALFSVGLFSIGLSIFMLFGCIAATKGMAVLTKKIVLWIKMLFVKKEGAK